MFVYSYFASPSRPIKSACLLQKDRVDHGLVLIGDVCVAAQREHFSIERVPSSVEANVMVAQAPVVLCFSFNGLREISQ